MINGKGSEKNNPSDYPILLEGWDLGYEKMFPASEGSAFASKKCLSFFSRF